MSTEILTTYDVDPQSVVVAGGPTTVYNAGATYGSHPAIVGGVIGGTLGTINSLWINARFKVTVGAGNTLTVSIKYGASLQVDLTFQAIAGVTNEALIVEAFLSALGSASVQVLHAYGAAGTAAANWNGFPNNRAGGTEDSASDQPLIITLTGNGTKEHVTVVKVGAPLALTPPEATRPLTMLYSIGPLVRFPHSLFKDIRVYAELRHNLDYMGPGVITFTRASTSTATWNDGASHAVAVNQPRFEYSGGASLGLLFNSGAGESLSFPSASGLGGANTLYWKENNVWRTTFGGANPNPFTAGVWTGNNSIHIADILQFGKVLNAAEHAIVSKIWA